MRSSMTGRTGSNPAIRPDDLVAYGEFGRPSRSMGISSPSDGKGRMRPPRALESWCSTNGPVGSGWSAVVCGIPRRQSVTDSVRRSTSMATTWWLDASWTMSVAATAVQPSSFAEAAMTGCSSSDWFHPASVHTTGRDAACRSPERVSSSVPISNPSMGSRQPVPPMSSSEPARERGRSSVARRR